MNKKAAFAFFGILLLASTILAATDQAPILLLETGRHTGAIHAISADTKGEFILTASTDKTARLWDSRTGKLLRIFRVPVGANSEGELYSAAITPDGSRIAVSGYTYGKGITIYIFDRRNGHLLHRIGGLTNTVSMLSYTPDGQYLIAGVSLEGLRLFDADGYMEIGKDEAYEGVNYDAHMDNNGRIVVASEDGFYSLYSVGSAKPSALRLITKRKSGPEAPSSVTFNNDGARIAVGYLSGGMEILSGHDLSRLYEMPSGGPAGQCLWNVAWSSDGKKIYASGKSRDDGNAALRIWNSDSNQIYKDIELPAKEVMAIQPLADGRLVYAAADGSWGALDPAGNLQFSVRAGKASFYMMGDNLLASEDGRTIEFRQGSSTGVRFSIDERQMNGPASQTTILYPPNPKTEGVVLECTDNGAQFTLNGKRLNLGSGVSRISYQFDDDRNRFLVGARSYLQLYDLDAKRLWGKSTPDVIWSVNLTRDGRYVIAAFEDGVIRWYRASDGKELLALFVHFDEQSWVLWTPEKHYDAGGNGFQFVKWQVNKEEGQSPSIYKREKYGSQYFRPDLIMEALTAESGVSN